MSERTYRLSPPDRTGWLLGLGGPQVVVLGAALVAVAVAVDAGLPVAAGAVVVAVAAVLALVRAGGRSLVEWVPTVAHWCRHGRRGATWLAPLEPAGTETDSPHLPPPLEAHRLVAFDAGDCELGVAVDPDAGTYAGTLRVAGRQFALVERGEQDALLALWGDALAAFCREGCPVVEVRWSEWAAPAGMDEQHAYLAEHGVDDPTDPAVASYRQLLRRAAPVATRHEVLLTVVVAARRVRTGSRHRPRAEAACEALAEELRQLARRLEAAGLAVSAPLGVGELARVLRARLDPKALPVLDRRARSLGERAGVVAPADAGPLAARSAWGQWQVDGALHRVFWFREWPRFDVGPSWMSDLLLYGTAVRTVTVCYRPVPLRASHRAIQRQAARLEADVDHRRRSGFRVGAQHRRTSRAVEEREEELVAGYAELQYVGLVAVCAPDAATLERACDDVVQVSAGCGIELRPLDGRHAEGAAACLPLAWGLASSGPVL